MLMRPGSGRLISSSTAATNALGSAAVYELDRLGASSSTSTLSGTIDVVDTTTTGDDELDAGLGEPARGTRVLVVPTSSLDGYQQTRRFYRVLGFDEEARVRDFYGPGDHKVVFWKSLVAAAPSCRPGRRPRPRIATALRRPATRTIALLVGESGEGAGDAAQRAHRFWTDQFAAHRAAADRRRNRRGAARRRRST